MFKFTLHAHSWSFANIIVLCRLGSIHVIFLSYYYRQRTELKWNIYIIHALPKRNWREFQTFYIRPRSGTDLAQWDWGINNLWLLQVKLCGGFFVLQVRSYNIYGMFLNLFQWIRMRFGYTSWPSWASILYYRSDDTPIVVKQFFFINTYPLQVCERIKPFECFSMNFVNMWSPFKVTRHIYSKKFEDGNSISVKAIDL